MEKRAFWSPFSEVLALLTQHKALICLAAMIVVQLGGNYAITAVSGPFPPGGHRMVPVILLAVQAIKFATFIGVFYVLARSFGGHEGSAGKPNLVIWLGLMIAYFTVSRLATMLPTALPDMGQMGTRRLPATLSAISYGVRLVFFPIMMFVAAAVHDYAAVRLSEVWSFLTSRGLAWYLCFALFGLIYAAALFIMPLGMGTASGVPPRGALFAIALVGMGGQLIGMLFAIAAYRAMRA
jgi:hypothetical protein